MPTDTRQTTPAVKAGERIEFGPMPEPPSELKARAEAVSQAVRDEAEAQKRAGFSYGEAVRRAMILTAPARKEVGDAYAAWAASLEVRVRIPTDGR